MIKCLVHHNPRREPKLCDVSPSYAFIISHQMFSFKAERRVVPSSSPWYYAALHTADHRHAPINEVTLMTEYSFRTFRSFAFSIRIRSLSCRTLQKVRKLQLQASRFNMQSTFHRNLSCFFHHLESASPKNAWGSQMWFSSTFSIRSLLIWIVVRIFDAR